MKKTIQLASLFLSLLHILLCLSFRVHVTEARDLLVVDEAPPPLPLPPPPRPKPPMLMKPSPPCGSNIGSQVMTTREQSCRKIRRHHHAAAPRPPRKN
ncbi:hypothetical protein AALP_AAs63758U000200 [Arabis alpina]|uniref:Uncharacterized protein n=1 Tax=Arabis alpina TaxID=50452 RepID=A0A087G392_ARAAL|nr:hypothetical protein AALP_AAs63758U000200 [Arabis alpina]